MPSKLRAFTLIELLVVVAIIGILADVGIVAYDGYTKSAKRSSTDILCKQIIKEVKAQWLGCQIGRPCHLKNSGSGIVDTRSDWCTFNSSTNLTAQAFVGHYGGYASSYKWGPQNPYRPGIAAVNTSCPIDDKLKPGCIEIIGSDKNNSSCGNCNPPVKAGEFIFQCYNLDSNGQLTKYREHFQAR